MPICIQSAFFVLCSQPKASGAGVVGGHLPNPCSTSPAFHFPPSLTQTPLLLFASVAKFGLFPWWRYWTVSQINCQCPGHFMVPLIIFCAAGVGPRSCGAAIVIEASLGYRWIVRSVGQSLAVIARVGGEALLQQSEQGPGCLILVLHAARCMLGECITNSLPSLPLPLCKPCFSLLLTSL